MADDSTMKFRADISELKAAMQQASRAIKVANSEFKAATAGMDSWNKSADGLRAKLKQLDTVLAAEKKQLQLANQELEKTVKVYGENSAEADRARIKVNNFEASVKKTESQLNKYESELKDVESGSKELGNAVDDAGKKAKKAGDGFTVMKGALSNLVASGVRAGINGLRTLITEVVDLGKQSVNAYAEYEQLVGGVETLFGTGGMSIEEYAKSVGKTVDAVKSEYDKLMSAQNEVMDNAAGAYKTAGMSANEYMDTVTSFSASLIQGLDGDTAKAAKYADIAITDMSDNANKMGTDISLIQNAYQGFAKDNYTMLDNLKLGYGGTQSEMARLVNESGVMGKSFEATAENVKDIPFDKLIEAIHKTQEEMGIAGTTSKEASDTIEGSVNSMKAAWQNLLVGMSDDSQDIDKLWDEFIGAAETAAKNVFPRVKILVSNVTSFISKKLRENFPELMANVDKAKAKIETFFKFVIQNSDTILNVLKAVGIAIATAFVVNKVATFVSSITTLIGVFRGLKTATEGATLATRALALAQTAMPWVAIAAAIAGVVAGMIALKKHNDEQIRSQYELTEAEKQSIEAVNQSTDAYNQLADARKSASEGVTAEFGYLDQLKTEYNSLVDSNGNVKKGYQDRANFILNELASSLGVERSEIEKNINKNGELGASIDELIQKQQAQAMLSANEDAYNKAISERGQALQTWQQQMQLADEKEKAYAQTKQNLADKESYYQRLLASGNPAAATYAATVDQARTANEAAKKAYDDVTNSVKQAENTYIGYNSTIQNYESLSAAIISGNTDKIKTALSNMETNFITAKNGTKATLQQQVTDLTNNYNAMKQAVDSGMPGVTQAQVDAAKDLVDKAKTELNKLAPNAKKSGEKAGSQYAAGVGSKSGSAKKSGEKVGKAADSGAKSGAKNSKKTGQKAGQDYAKGVEGAKSKSKKAGESVAKAGDDAVKKSAKDSKKTGEKTGTEFAKGVESKKSSAKSAGSKLGSEANTGAGQFRDNANISGNYFGQGFINGINAKQSAAYAAGYRLGQKAHAGMKAGQDEGSPSKLTYKSGVYFTQGYINGIASMQKSLVKTVKGLTSTATKELAKMSGFNFSEVAQNASTKIADAMSSKTSYMLAKMQYQNENKLKEFDTTISNLEKKRDKKQSDLEKARDAKVAALEKKRDKAKSTKTKNKLKKEIDSTKKNYNKQISAVKSNYTKLINTQNKYKNAYQAASSQMLSEFQSAINSYQSAAQKLIDDTINGITDKYNDRYNDLISKQDSLIEKLKNASDLFEVSGAGVMTVNDIQEQTKAINDYTSKLQKIKQKVSSELFDQIATYDMKEGSAFMDRLLAMSANDLEAYNKAYTEKMKAAQKAGESIYKADFDKVAADYKKEIDKAFDGLPKQLEKLGNDAMKGFVNGLTKNTDYMDKNVKTFVKGMVHQFKKQLKIKSPSRLMMEIGDFTGQGFNDGLLSVVKDIQKTAGQIANAVSSPLDGVTANIGGVRSAVGSVAPGGGVYGGGSNVVNNYNLVQNNTSPKALTALETYQARRRQIALVKAATGNL